MAANTHPLAEAITNQPLLIDPQTEQLVGATISYLSTNEHALKMIDAASDPHADDEFWDEDSWHAHYRPYVVKDGILHIPVNGLLLNNFPFAFGRWATGYQYIEKAYERGLADDNVKGIALVSNSGGGEVAGCFECAEKIYNGRGEKPVRAFSSDSAYSAAYALCSAAETISVTRSGGTGSVGVVTAHVDISEALAQDGIKVTFIYAGKHKVDGNSYEKLPDSVKDRIQGRIDRLYGQFTSTVALHRGMEDQAVRDTEALTYDATESVEVGFADQIGSFEDEMAAFTSEVAETQEAIMATKTPASATDEATFTQAQMDTATTDAKATGKDEGIAAERTRMETILGSDEAKTHPNFALSAVRKGMDADMATEMMAELPAEASTASTEAAPAPKADAENPFDAAMSTTENPNVGADAGTGDEEDIDDDDKATAGIVAAVQMGKGSRKKTERAH